MQIRTRIAVAIAIAAVGAASSAVSAKVFVWNWTLGDPVKGGLNHNGGAIESVHAKFDTVTNHVTWNTVFSNKITNGYTLAINNGPNPKGHGGELALMYFDAKTLSDPKLSIYAYNGKNSSTSFKDGNGNLAGDQTPDRLKSINDTSYIQNIKAFDVETKRHLELTIDASSINAHFPLYASPTNDWTGAQFAEKLGLWFHPVKGLDSGYNANGFLTKWNKTTEGWFDASDHDTTQIIPLPSAGFMGALTLACGFGVRRRRNTL